MHFSRLAGGRERGGCSRAAAEASGVGRLGTGAGAAAREGHVPSGLISVVEMLTVLLLLLLLTIAARTGGGDWEPVLQAQRPRRQWSPSHGICLLLLQGGCKQLPACGECAGNVRSGRLR